MEQITHYRKTTQKVINFGTPYRGQRGTDSKKVKHRSWHLHRPNVIPSTLFPHDGLRSSVMSMTETFRCGITRNVFKNKYCLVQRSNTISGQSVELTAMVGSSTKCNTIVKQVIMINYRYRYFERVSPAFDHINRDFDFAKQRLQKVRLKSGGSYRTVPTLWQKPRNVP